MKRVTITFDNYKKYEAVKHWCEENMQLDCWQINESSKRNKQLKFTFYFNSNEDLLLFYLTWM